jgi:DNA repair protein RecO (recombination protein O)
MKRNFRTEGIILKNNRFGEIHKGVIFLSPEHGIMNAVAYGAYSIKGKLRSITNPLCAGTFFLYRDPVKDTCKISDLDCREFFEGVRGSIVKFFIASVWLETILKTFGGDSAETFSLLRQCLRLLDTCVEAKAPQLLVQFIWRYLGLAGLAPDLRECAGCGKLRGEAESFVYRRGASGFFCADCGQPAAPGSVDIPSGALEYLRYSGNVAVEKAADVSLDAGSFSSLKKALLFLAEDLAGGALNSIRTGAGVL